MSQTFSAIYEHGVLRPLVPLSLPDRAQVELTIEANSMTDWLDQDALRLAEEEGDVTISLEEVRCALATIPGSLADDVIADRGEY